MPHNELRKDYLLNRWVVIATERARRPTDFAQGRKEQVKTSSCPLCVGNEHMTPPAVLAYVQSKGEIHKVKEEGAFRTSNWLIRNIPNLYPAFSPPDDPLTSLQRIREGNLGHAIGHHEVLVESPNHNDHPADAKLSQVIHVIDAYRDRLSALSRKPYVRYVQIFRNHGVEAGASLSHAHSQIIATPFVPAIVSSEIEASKAYYNQHNNCVFCDIIKRETQTSRMISNDEHFTVFAPFASVHPLEFWIVPKRHAPNFLDLTDKEVAAFSFTLKKSLKALKELLNDPPYNYGIHLAINKEAKNYYHWHLEVYPTLAIWAGFEKSTGMYINTVRPETAAQSLKNIQ